MIANVPPLHILSGGYQLRVHSPTNGYWGNGWVPINSSDGYPWTIKGFAINKAKKMMNYRGWWGNAYYQVLELETGDIVWQSDNMKVRYQNG